jgi:hypothetical protein
MLNSLCYRLFGVAGAVSPSFFSCHQRKRKILYHKLFLALTLEEENKIVEEELVE